MKIKLNLLVLRCQDIEKSKTFYEKLSLNFVKEKHGKGDEHYACMFDDMIFELYPLKTPAIIDNTRLGFTLDINNMREFLEKEKIDIIMEYTYDTRDIFVVYDPDMRKVELKCKI